MLSRIILYTYNSNNIEDIMTEINGQLKIITSNDIYAELKKEDPFKEIFEQFKYFDLSLLMLGENERADAWLYSVITLIQAYLNSGNHDACFIMDKRYGKNVQINVPYFVSETEPLEQYLGLDQRIITNIVDISNDELIALKTYFYNNLYGNEKFKTRLFEEIVKFRVFNKLGEHKIFSAFICGPSGIGKTESAWLLHNKLAPKERFIKINLGNYSEQNALSSLIGSPRGFIGSSKGELTDKIETSKSKVILIDEFEKASGEVHNFFLELLADGKFTDSLGREYDLDKYIIIFTSNFSPEEFTRNVSPELRSRFDLKFQMNKLSSIEKQNYVSYKTDYYLEKVKKTYNLSPTQKEKDAISDIDFSDIHNLREINRLIENKITDYVCKNINEDDVE